MEENLMVIYYLVEFKQQSLIEIEYYLLPLVHS